VISVIQLLFVYSVSLFSNDCIFTQSTTPEENLQAILDQVETSPFMKACHQPEGLLTGRPKTGLLKRAVPEKDDEGRTARVFLQKIVKKVRKQVSEGQNINLNISKCIGSNHPRCDELKHWMKKELPEYISEARYHLSLAQSPSEVKSWMTQAKSSANSKLDPLGSFKAVPWKPLDDTESLRASKDLEDYQKQIEANQPKAASHKEIIDFKNQSLLSVRYKHYLSYHQMMAQLPLLQHLDTQNFTEMDLLGAITKMQESLKEETNKLDAIEKSLKSSGPLPSSVLELMNYSSLVEETLLEDSKDCKIATSLLYTLSDRELGNGLALGLPIMGASFFAPPFVALAAGLGVGGVFAYQSHSDFSKAQQRSLGYVYGDSSGDDLKNLDQKSFQSQFDRITLPVGFGLAGLLTKKVVMSRQSLNYGLSLFKNYKK